MKQITVRSLYQCWQYRGFIRNAVVNDARIRFSRSSMGGVWLVLQPLLQAALLALILSAVLQARLPGIQDTKGYAAYLLAGMLCWSLFTETWSRGATLFIDNASLIKKISFPLPALILVCAGTCLTSNLFLAMATLLVLFLLGFGMEATLVYLPLLLGVTLLLGLGLGLLTGILNVFVRDIGLLLPVILQFLFWLCPIVYSPASLPPAFRLLGGLNPVSGLVQGYQQSLVFGLPPETGGLWLAAVTGLLVWGLACWLLGRTFAQMVDIL